MVDVVVVGSINMDTFIQVENLPKPGETLHGLSKHKFPGGKGANQATALARLGDSVSLMGMVGDDLDGNILTEGMKENHVDVAYLLKNKDKSTGSSVIIVDQHGNNQIIVFSGANSGVDKDFINQTSRALVNAKYLLMQYEIPIETIKLLIELAHESKIPVIINPSPYYPIEDDLLKKIDYLILNESEASYLLDLEIPNMSLALTAADLIHKKGIKHVVVTLGEQGCVICDESGQVEHIPPFKVHPVDTTGSGDAFIGGFLHSLLANKSFKEAVNFANAVGAITVTKLGAQTSLPYLQEVNHFIKD
jgi:ribokinase